MGVVIVETGRRWEVRLSVYGIRYILIRDSAYMSMCACAFVCVHLRLSALARPRACVCMCVCARARLCMKRGGDWEGAGVG